MNRCYCTSKTRKSESNSQRCISKGVILPSCYCTSKTRKSESNSQRGPSGKQIGRVVIALVKLENLKAIHNTILTLLVISSVVIALVKLENLKEAESQTARKGAMSTTI